MKKNTVLTLILLTIGVVSASERVGPYVGSVSPTEAHFLFRPGVIEQSLRLVVFEKGGEVITTDEAQSSAKNDFVAKFKVTGLEEGTRYHYRIERREGERWVVSVEDERATFKTVDQDRQTKVTAVLLSCVREKDTAPVWREIGKIKPDLLCLSGDTPYIDSTDLAVVRRKHRAFLQEEPLAPIGLGTSVVGTWDDHDFGLNNSNGLSLGEGIHATRQGFIEYRAHASIGQNDGGIYHKSDWGALEIFHLDPRTFSQLEGSPVDPSQPTCFGKSQWEWIRTSLKASRAPFKVLSMGAIWQDKKNAETDDMFTYYYERDALFDFIKKEKIDGVILHGGDIHVSRYLKHPKRVGYDLHDFIVSPGHLGVIPSLNPFHPSLEWSLVEGQQFITLEADPTLEDPELVATFRQPEGKVNKRIVMKHSELKVEEPESSRRAHWRFEKGLENESSLGERLNGTAHGGARIESGANRTAGALRLQRSATQFVNIPRSFLDDNSPGHSLSCWIKPSSLPEHGSSDRYFILESTAEGRPDAKPAWHLSLELAPTKHHSEVAVKMHTHTLVPAVNAQKAPTARPSGPFTTDLPRRRFEDRWSHLVIVFDSLSLTLFLDGEKVATHSLPAPGPASEFGGLIIGGHRAGTGRNFDGWIDEVSIWQEVLTPAKIADLFRNEKNLVRDGEVK